MQQRRRGPGNTTIATAEQVEAAHAVPEDAEALHEIVADKGYHSHKTMMDRAAMGLRSYISAPERGRRDFVRRDGCVGLPEAACT